MTKNTLLNIAITIARILKGLLIVGAILLTVLLVYTQIDSEVFANREIKISQSSSSFGYSRSDSSTFNDANKDSSPFTIGKLKTVSTFVFYFKGLLVLALYYMSINAFEKIMLSVKTLKTFNVNNAKLFRRIGQYIIAISILTSYSVMRFESGIQSKLAIEFTPLIVALLAFILAEIFKEGNDLKQENDLTI